MEGPTELRSSSRYLTRNETRVTPSLHSAALTAGVDRVVQLGVELHQRGVGDGGVGLEEELRRGQSLHRLQEVVLVLSLDPRTHGELHLAADPEVLVHPVHLLQRHVHVPLRLRGQKRLLPEGRDVAVDDGQLRLEAL